jgi:TRAP-type transport system small permease protein
MFEKAVAKFKKGVFSTGRIAGFVGMAALAALMLIPLIDILMRRIFTSALPGAYELSELALGLMVFATLAYCGVRGSHIVVDVITSHLPRKTQGIVDIVILFISSAAMGLMSWQLISRAFTLKAGHEVTTILYIPVFPFVLLAGLGCVLLALVFLAQFLDKTAEAVKK